MINFLNQFRYLDNKKTLDRRLEIFNKELRIFTDHGNDTGL
jgi:hypothetical protein